MKKTIFFSVIFLNFMVLAFAQADLQVLAVVKLNKSESITVKQLKTRSNVYEKQAGKPLSIEEKKQVLDSLIYEKLVNQAAQKAGLSISDSNVNQYFLQNMSQMVGKQVTEQELNTIIRQQTSMSLDEYMRRQAGMSVSEYKEYLKAQLTAQQYILHDKKNELEKISATDEEIRAFYELNRANFVWSDMIRIFLVYVQKGDKPLEAKAKATELWNSYKDKKQTRDQITVKSHAENSGFQAGEMLVNKTEASAVQLGISYTDLIELFSKSKGFISDLQDNETNCQFYSVLDKYNAKMLAISDVVQPGTTTTVYEYIKLNLAQQKQMEFLQQAATQISASLDKPENVDRKKTGAELDKLLSW